MDGQSKDLNIDDEGVLLAYYDRIKTDPTQRATLDKELASTASHRNSRWLKFAYCLRSHLNDDTMDILRADETNNPSNENLQHENNVVSSSKKERVSESGVVDLEGLKSDDEPTIAQDTFQGLSPEYSILKDIYSSSDKEYSDDSEDSDYDPASDDPSSSGSDADFSLDGSGRIFDGMTWRCADCYSELVDQRYCWNDDCAPQRCSQCDGELSAGVCPNCHARCKNCNSVQVGGICALCGGEGEGEEEEEDHVVFDDEDGIWRCAFCNWEVEADSDEVGYCHCEADSFRAHLIDLSEILDFDPGDSDSSMVDSSESEADSEDERFIDETEYPNLEAMDGIFPGFPLAQAVEVNSSALLETPSKDGGPLEPINVPSKNAGAIAKVMPN